MESETLRDLRLAADLHLREVGERMAASGAPVPATRQGISHIEQRGTKDITLLRALAFAFQVPLERVERAALNSLRLAKNKVANSGN